MPVTTTAVVEHDVAGRMIAVPLRIPSAHATVLTMTADAAACQARLPHGLQATVTPRGRALVTMMSVRYLDSPLDRYDEVVVGIVAAPGADEMEPNALLAGVRTVLAGTAGIWIEHMAVTEPFTLAAGTQIWGYPKTLDPIEIAEDATGTTTRWRQDGADVLTMQVPAGRVSLATPPVPASTYTQLDGTVVRTGLRTRVRGVRLARRGVSVQLGQGQAADGLRALQLGPPVIGATLSGVSMTFGNAAPIGSDR